MITINRIIIIRYKGKIIMTWQTCIFETVIYFTVIVAVYALISDIISALVEMFKAFMQSTVIYTLLDGIKQYAKYKLTK